MRGAYLGPRFLENKVITELEQVGAIYQQLEDDPLFGRVANLLDKGKVVGTQVVWEYVVGGAMRFEIGTISKAVDAVIAEQALGLAKAVGGVIEEAESEAEKSSKFDEAFGPDEDEKTPVTGIGKGR